MSNDAFITALTTARAQLDTALRDAAAGRRLDADREVASAINVLEYVATKSAAMHRELEALNGQAKPAPSAGGTQP